MSDNQTSTTYGDDDGDAVPSRKYLSTSELLGTIFQYERVCANERPCRDRRHAD